MATNRIGLEQTLSDEAAAAVATLNHLGYTWQGGEQWKPPVGLPPPYINDDRAELEAYRKASKKAVALTDEIELEDMTIHGHAKMFKSRRAMGKPDPDSVVKLYAAPPLQAVTVPDEPTDDERLMEIEGVSVVKLPPEFHSEHGVVVQLEKVMAALAVHGIKYERRHQKVVGLRVGIDAVRAEGIDVDAEKINAEKCHK